MAVIRVGWKGLSWMTQSRCSPVNFRVNYSDCQSVLSTWENLECRINYLPIILSCLLQAPKCRSWELLFWGVLRGYSVSRQRHVETKMQIPETLTWALQPCPVSRGSGAAKFPVPLCSMVLHLSVLFPVSIFCSPSC